jgi:two-component system, chemotaxis family, response regulator Rcp1
VAAALKAPMTGPKNGPMAARPNTILLVEDNAGDAELMRLALAEARPDCRLRVAGDGEAALELLRAGHVPDLLLLDLNLPRLTGHEVLADLRASKNQHLRRLPVVVLSSSGAPQEVQRSYDLFASSHIVKPADLDRLFEIAAALTRYWFETVALA